MSGDTRPHEPPGRAFGRHRTQHEPSHMNQRATRQRCHPGVCTRPDRFCLTSPVLPVISPRRPRPPGTGQLIYAGFMVSSTPVTRPRPPGTRGCRLAASTRTQGSYAQGSYAQTAGHIWSQGAGVTTPSKPGHCFTVRLVMIMGTSMTSRYVRTPSLWEQGDQSWFLAQADTPGRLSLHDHRTLAISAAADRFNRGQPRA